MDPRACFSIQDEASFNRQALEVFRYQAEHVAVYRDFLKALNKTPESILTWTEIPCLPLEFFRSKTVIANDKVPEITFSSSGTTGMITSSHAIVDARLYEESFLKCFDLFYGAPSNYCVIGLLPAYLERAGSSLVYMADRLIKESQHPDSGFYLYQYEKLSTLLTELYNRKQPTILIGVTFALLDLAATFPVSFPELIVIETGGMKGRRKEMIREELHELLKAGFGVSAVHGEYGMTELLSQAYSKSDGNYSCPPWMKVRIREVNDPFSFPEPGITGGVNIIDLANVYSCSFLATQDLGKVHADGSFEILGRFDNSDLRGCNLMVV